VAKKEFKFNSLNKMKKFDLNNCGVQEMNAEEMRVTEGGNPALFLLAFCLIMCFLRMAEA